MPCSADKTLIKAKHKNFTRRMRKQRSEQSYFLESERKITEKRQQEWRTFKFCA
jgi:hypothetical protein